MDTDNERSQQIAIGILLVLVIGGFLLLMDRQARLEACRSALDEATETIETTQSAIDEFSSASTSGLSYEDLVAGAQNITRPEAPIAIDCD